MAYKNVRTRGENVSSSSFLEVAGPSSIKTEASFSSTIRDVLLDPDTDKGLKANMSAIEEEQGPLYSTLDDGFTETCTPCLIRDRTRIEATHFCPGCGRRGRYMCMQCLKVHTLWCKGAEHKVESLSVDRHLDQEHSYYPIKNLKQGPPIYPPREHPIPTEYQYINRWLIENPNRLEISEGNRKNITQHDIASSYEMSLSDGLSSEVSTVNRRPQQGRYSAPISEGESEHVYEHMPRRETMSHIYADPLPLIRFPSVPNLHQRRVRDPSSWDDMSTATTKRLNTVYTYNDHTMQDRPTELIRERWNASMDTEHKKNKKCVIQ